MSSDGVVNTWLICMPKSVTGEAVVPLAICIAGAPYSEQSSTAAAGSGFFGGIQRSGPTGGAP